MEELYSRLYEQIKHWLIPMKYTAVPQLKQFRRPYDGGHQCIVISSAGQHPVEIEVFLGIRVNLVEELAYQFTMGLSEYGPHSTTLLIPAKRVIERLELRYELHRAEDLGNVQSNIEEFMLTYGYAFLDQYSSMSALDRLYNAKPEQKVGYIINEYHRALRGIILAKLVQSQFWPELAQIYQRKLEKKATPEVQLDKYIRLVEFLRNHSFN